MLLIDVLSQLLNYDLYAEDETVSTIKLDNSQTPDVSIGA